MDWKEKLLSELECVYYLGLLCAFAHCRFANFAAWGFLIRYWNCLFFNFRYLFCVEHVWVAGDADEDVLVFVRPDKILDVFDLKGDFADGVANRLVDGHCYAAD